MISSAQIKRRDDQTTHDLLGEVDEEDGLADLVGHLALSGLGDVVSDNVRALDTVGTGASDVVVDAVLDGVAVVHAHEGTRRRSEGLSLGPERVDESLGLGVGENSVDSAADLEASGSAKLTNDEES